MTESKWLHGGTCAKLPSSVDLEDYFLNQKTSTE
jgi:hypothetical protein